METLSYGDSALSLVVPVVAIGLAVLTRRVLLALGVGILLGSILLTSFHPVQALAYMFWGLLKIFLHDVAPLQNGQWEDIALHGWNIGILLFLFLLGVMTSLISLAGGTRAFGDWAWRRVKTPKGSQLLTLALGLLLFIDDYFNALAVGTICRPLTDRHRISRAKLAYLIDATAAPVCVLTPMSSWGAYIIAVINTVLLAHDITDVTAFWAFIQIIPGNFYALFALPMVAAVIWWELDVGFMKQHRKLALQGQLYDASKGEPPGTREVGGSDNGQVRDLIVPVVVLVTVTVGLFLWTGAQALRDAYEPFSVMGAFEHTHVATSLVYAGLVSILVTVAMLLRHQLALRQWKRACWAGVTAMLPAIAILICAWMLVEIMSALGTGKYLAGLAQGFLQSAWLPMLMFILSGAMAFATGTSWGTFGIMLPIAGDLAATTAVALLLPTLAAVLAGAVFGDHCSLISDTTIMSSTGAACHHIDHVWTQLPYALAVAGICIVSYAVVGLSGSVIAGLLTGVSAFVAIVGLLHRLSRVGAHRTAP